MELPSLAQKLGREVRVHTRHPHFICYITFPDGVGAGRCHGGSVWQGDGWGLGWLVWGLGRGDVGAWHSSVVVWKFYSCKVSGELWISSFFQHCF